MDDLSDILEDVVQNGGNDDGETSDTGIDINEMSKEEVAKRAIERGRVKIDDERAVIRCPHTDEQAKLIKGGRYDSDTVYTMYACAVYPIPDPDNPGEDKMVCSGPVASKKEYKRHDMEEMSSGCGAFDDCPYNSNRL